MNLSSGGFVFKNGDVYCVFNRFSLKKFYLSKNEFENPPSSTIKKLEKLKLINSKINLNNIKEKYSKPYFAVMYLILSDSCNLQCNYCFVEQGFEKHVNSMPLEVAIKAIDLFNELSKRSGVKKPKIIFYGGEPTLNKKVLIEIIKYAKKYDINFEMVTNGTLMDEELAKFLTENKVDVGVSIDGPKEVHDKKRIYADGKGSFEKALNGFKILKKYNPNTSISCTLSTHNINKKVGIGNVIDFFKKIGVNNYCINFLNYNFNDKIDSKKLSLAFIDNFIISKRYLLADGRVLRHTKAFVEEAFHFKDCAGLGEQIVVLPNGKIGPCQAYASTEKYFIKTVNDEPSSFFEDETFKKWALRFPLNIKKCLDCNAIGICGGGCAYYTEQTKGRIEDVDERYCVIMNDFLNFLIWDFYYFTHPFYKVINVDAGKLIVREVNKKDQKKFTAFLNELEPQAPYFETKEFMKIKDYVEKYSLGRRSKLAFYLVLVWNGKIVGFASYALNPDKKFELGIAILKKFRSKGIGSMLINETLKEAKRNRIDKLIARVMPENQTMIKILKKTGFKLKKQKIKSKFSLYIKYYNYNVFPHANAKVL